MGKKADLREARITAARARDAAFEQHGAQDAHLLAFLARMPKERQQRVRQSVLATLERPMNPGRPAAYALLGAFSQLDLIAQARSETAMLVPGEALTTEVGGAGVRTAD